MRSGQMKPVVADQTHKLCATGLQKRKRKA